MGIATAIVWVRRARETGSRAARPRGQPRGSKLDIHREAILGWIAEKDDITLAEIRERRLQVDREFDRHVAGVPPAVHVDHVGQGPAPSACPKIGTLSLVIPRSCGALSASDRDTIPSPSCLKFPR